MCTPLALGIAAGGASAVTGIMQQNRAHRAQVDAVNRSNQIARQKYLNDITISAFNDRQKGQVFTAQLQADAASRAAFYKQKEFNQIEANRASESAQQELREKITESLFSSQANFCMIIFSAIYLIFKPVNEFCKCYSVNKMGLSRPIYFCIILTCFHKSNWIT